MLILDMAYTLEIVKKICRLMDFNPNDLVIMDQDYDERHHTIQTIDETRELLNWSPEYSIEKGLRETVEWYKMFFSKNLRIKESNNTSRTIFELGL